MPDMTLTADEFQEASGADDWRVLSIGASCWFDAPSHAAGAELMGGIVNLVRDCAPPPDIDLRRTGVHVRIPAGSSGPTATDVSFARAVSGVARSLGLSPTQQRFSRCT